MKKLTFTLFAVLSITFNVIAQAPMTINYQAIVRDANNFLMTDREIGMRVSILYGSEDGEAVYVETHRPTVSRYGMISIEIGSGQHVSGDWAINWQSGAFFLKTEYDIGNGTIGYTVSATSKLLAVPVALFSHTSSRLTGPAWDFVGAYEPDNSIWVVGSPYIYSWILINYLGVDKVSVCFGYDTGNADYLDATLYGTISGNTITFPLGEDNGNLPIMSIGFLSGSGTKVGNNLTLALYRAGDYFGTFNAIKQ